MPNKSLVLKRELLQAVHQQTNLRVPCPNYTKILSHTEQVEMARQTVASVYITTQMRWQAKKVCMISSRGIVGKKTTIENESPKAKNLAFARFSFT